MKTLQKSELWTNEEQQKFIEALNVYGNKMTPLILHQISTRIPTKTPHQVYNFLIDISLQEKICLRGKQDLNLKEKLTPKLSMDQSIYLERAFYKYLHKSKNGFKKVLRDFNKKFPDAAFEDEEEMKKIYSNLIFDIFDILNGEDVYITFREKKEKQNLRVIETFFEPLRTFDTPKKEHNSLFKN
eukprot:maker-scaffold_1-snap-gene-2.3-mRNA-1 protein AED:0.00 eAED:0.00 QI:26/1/1/1/1/1/2/55/184